MYYYQYTTTLCSKTQSWVIPPNIINFIHINGYKIGTNSVLRQVNKFLKFGISQNRFEFIKKYKFASCSNMSK